MCWNWCRTLVESKITPIIFILNLTIQCSSLHEFQKIIRNVSQHLYNTVLFSFIFFRFIIITHKWYMRQIFLRIWNLSSKFISKPSILQKFTFVQRILIWIIVVEKAALHGLVGNKRACCYLSFQIIIYSLSSQSFE